MKRIKGIGGSKVIWLAALIVAAAALAGGIGAASLVGSKGAEVSASHRPDKASQETDENESTEQEAVEGQGAEDGANHGHCVSWYAHKSKDDGLSGKARGEFMSSVANSDGTRSKDGTTSTDCDFDSALSAAVAAQGLAVHGKSAEAHGKSGQPHGQPAADSDED